MLAAPTVRCPGAETEPATQASRTAATVRIDAGKAKWTISKYLTGSHFVYAFEADKLYRDERIAAWMRRSKVGVIRWPGGTAVQSYHWDKLNGIAFKVDSWDPNYKSASKDPSGYMDLDEYITYCRRVKAEPMVGVNIKSGKLYNRQGDSLDEARRLIQYCRDKKYRVKYWYIGNECYIGFGHKAYAGYIDKYASVLKAVDPKITIVADWKFGPRAKKRFDQCLDIVRLSKHVDIMEIHEKWGNKWGLASGETLSDWRKQYPIYNGELGSFIRKFHRELAGTDRAGVKLGFNEWGLGSVRGADEFDHALIAADFMIELFRNRVHQACYWNLNMGARPARVLVRGDDQKSLKSLNPVARIFEMYAGALGRELLEMTSSRRDAYGFAVRDAARTTVQIYLLNKSAARVSAGIDITGAARTGRTVQTESFIRPGKLVISDPVKPADSERADVALSPWSFNRITIRWRTAKQRVD